jgi:5'-methylthioadenosine phosphorylase
MKKKPEIAIIGGSGLYQMDGLDVIEHASVETPFGEPSAPILIGKLGNQLVAFLARHGIGHHIAPSDINYRANIYALKSLGVKMIVSVSACGSLREDFAPGHFVIPDQLFDFTKNRKRTFFEGGHVAHIGVADPFCPDLSKQVYDATQSVGGTVHIGGTFITIEGPRFSTRAESNAFRSWGMSIIGMTTSPEAYLAREAEICYAVLAHVTDYDVWHVSEEPVSVEMVIKILQENTNMAQSAIASFINNVNLTPDCDCENALASALITNPDVIPPETRQKLDLFVGKYFNK